MKLQSFIDWLVTNNYVTRKSSLSYESYVRNACLFSSINIEKVNTVDTVEDIINYLSQPNIGVSTNKSPKTLSNYISGLRLYGEFLNDTITSDGSNTVNSKNKTEKKTILNIGNTIYDKNELYKNFIFRLSTQDRFYEKIFFPISLIKQILYKNGEKSFYDAVLKKLLDNTQFRTPNGAFTLLDISELAITNEKVTVLINGVRHLLLTPTPTENLVLFNISNLKDISLDHVHSQYNIINEMQKYLPMLKQLTTVLKQANSKITNRKSLSSYKKIY